MFVVEVKLPASNVFTLGWCRDTEQVGASNVHGATHIRVYAHTSRERTYT